MDKKQSDTSSINAVDGQGLVKCEDGKRRPHWASKPGMMRDYYDNEWGIPVRDETGLFERLCLEGFQAGLSWELILKRRQNLRSAFADFNPDELAGWDPEQKLPELLNEPGMLRNKQKILSVLTNARACLKLRDNGGLEKLIWSFHDLSRRTPSTTARIPNQSVESRELANALKAAGFKFIGPVTAYALMQAVGVVNDRVGERTDTE